MNVTEDVANLIGDLLDACKAAEHRYRSMWFDLSGQKPAITVREEWKKLQDAISCCEQPPVTNAVYELQHTIADWKHATNCQSPEDARRHIESCQDLISDIACDYNINEGDTGEPISKGHKRCVDMAEAFIRKVTNRK